MRSLSISVVIGVMLYGCSPTLPKKELRQFTWSAKSTLVSDTLQLHLYNPLKCPLRVKATADQEGVQQLFGTGYLITLPPETDTILTYLVKSDSAPKVGFGSTFGDPTKPILYDPVSLPFPTGKRYKIIQGYEGGFSHTSSYSKYALDFSLAIGDTVCAVADGYVVGVIEGYNIGGESPQYRDYGNYITIYHPRSNIFTQYVHLKYEGSMVEVGDTIRKNQPIGLSGMTGQNQ